MESFNYSQNSMFFSPRSHHTDQSHQNLSELVDPRTKQSVMDRSLILKFWEASPEQFPGATRSELVRDFHNLFGRGSVLDFPRIFRSRIDQFWAVDP